MRSLFISLVLLVISITSNAAITFEVVGPCSEQPILSTVEPTSMAKNIGEFSVSVLEKSKLNFIGTENKIDSIDGSPVGEAALELLSRNEMRAYGWCYYVNGDQPEVYPNEVVMSKKVTSVKWVFGYAHYLNGEWLSMCEPSWKVKPAFICDKK